MPRPKLPPGARRVHVDITLARETLVALDALALALPATRSATVERLVLAETPEPVVKVPSEPSEPSSFRRYDRRTRRHETNPLYTIDRQASEFCEAWDATLAPVSRHLLTAALEMSSTEHRNELAKKLRSLQQKTGQVLRLLTTYGATKGRA